MPVSCNTLVRNLVLRSFISGSIDVTGKASFLKTLFSVKEKKHPLIYPVIGKMVSAVRTKDNNIFTAPLHKTSGHSYISHNLFFINHIKTSLTHHTCRHSDFGFFRWQPQVLTQNSIPFPLIAATPRPITAL